MILDGTTIPLFAAPHTLCVEIFVLRDCNKVGLVARHYYNKIQL